MSPTTIHRRRPARAARRSAAAAAAATAALLSFAAGALASEFTTDPAASASTVCTDGSQPDGSVVLSNLNASISAWFDVQVDGVTVAAGVEVLPGQSVTEVVDLVEDGSTTITVLADGVVVDTFVLSPDCFGGPTAALTLECGDTGLMFESTYVNPTPETVTFTSVDDGGTTFEIVRGPFSSGQLVQGQMAPPIGAWWYRVSVGGDVLLDEAGVADCVEPAASHALVCTADGPDLVTTFHADDVTRTLYSLDLPPSEVIRDGFFGIDPTTVWAEGGEGDQVVTIPLEEGASWSVTATAYGTTVLDASGSASCVDDEPQPEPQPDPQPEPQPQPEPEPQPEQPQPAPMPAVEAQPPAPAPVPVPVQATLPVTGGRTEAIAALAAAVTITGLWLRRAGRPRRA